jgi:hypothetical protein
MNLAAFAFAAAGFTTESLAATDGIAGLAIPKAVARRAAK